MKKLSVFSYILIILLSIAVLSIGTISIFSIKTLSDFIYNEVGSSLEEEARLIHNLVLPNLDDSPEPYQDLTKRIFEDLNIRITIITLEGLVLADSHKDYTKMENHGDRPEVIDALTGKVGNHTRFSTTLSQHMLYVTMPPADKNVVVRAAVSIDHIRNKFIDTFTDIAVFSIIILFIAVLISILTANTFTSIILSIKNISTYYAKGDFSRKLNDYGPREVFQLKKSINSMGEQLQEIIDRVSFQKNELQAMLNSMEDAVLLLNRKHEIKEMNPAAEYLIGKKLEDCRKEKITSFIDNDELTGLIQDSMALGEPLNKTILITRGLEMFFQVHSSPITGSEKSSDGILLVLHNMTRVKQLENMRKDFVANVSHELKTPITLINGFVETLMDGAIDDREKREQFLHVISRHSRRINHIIDDLLILSNIEDKGTNVNTEVVTLFDILFSAYTSALSGSEKYDVSLQVDCEDSIRIEVNPVLLEQAVLNLINNAVRYSGKGSHVLIRARETDENEVTIEVSDDGIGMAEDQLDRIFERFYRINRQQSKKSGGTGLGLSIVKHIALAHNGWITVDSKPGEGSSFKIFLPIRQF